MWDAKGGADGVSIGDVDVDVIVRAWAVMI